MASVKVLWRNQFAEDATWEAEEDVKARYLKLFTPNDVDTEGNNPCLIQFQSLVSMFMCLSSYILTLMPVLCKYNFDRSPCLGCFPHLNLHSRTNEGIL